MILAEVQTGQVNFPDKTAEILALAQELVRIPSVTACPDERLDDVRHAAALVYDYLQRSGLETRLYDQDKYPAVLAGFPGQLLSLVMLSGHFDVVAPEPDDSQFAARIEGDYLWGRGAADMKGSLAAMIHAVGNLERGELRGRVAISATVSEEVAEGGAFKAIVEALHPDFIVIGEATELNLNRGGRGRAVGRSGRGQILPQPVAGRAA